MTTIVATAHTRMLAKALLEHAKTHGPAEAVLRNLGACQRGQEAALVTSLLKLALSEHPEPVQPLVTLDLPDLTPEAQRTEEERVAKWLANAVGPVFGVNCDAILDPTLHRRQRGRDTQAAHVVQWVLRAHLDLSYTRIAALTGRTDHTTIMYAIRKVTNDPELNRVAKAILAAAQYDGPAEERSA